MPRKTWRAALAAYASPSTLVLLLLGFAAGLPYMLVFSTLSVWLREAGVARETIGYASLIGLAYAFKWVWSPLLDQWRLPLLGGLGQSGERSRQQQSTRGRCRRCGKRGRTECP